MGELTLESLVARVAELERKLAEFTGPSLRTPAEFEAAQRVADLTAVPDLARNPMWGEFLDAMRRNREEMAREDAERWAAEDAAAAAARKAG